MLTLNYRDSRPIYQQIKDGLRKLILTGVIAEDEKLPSVRSLAMELAPSHIRVNCVAPGVIRTDMLNEISPEIIQQLADETPLGRLGMPEDIAGAVAFLASDKASFITGQVLTVDGGFIG